MSLKALKEFKSELISLEDAVDLLTHASAVSATFDRCSVPRPEFLDDASRELTRIVETKRADLIAMRKSEIKSALATLESASDKRARLQAELRKLESAVRA